LFPDLLEYRVACELIQIAAGAKKRGSADFAPKGKVPATYRDYIEFVMFSNHFEKMLVLFRDIHLESAAIPGVCETFQ
jgi:hypothetical protein